MTHRLLSVLLALAAQVVPLAGPGVFILCVHEDGETQFELAIKPCCEGASVDSGISDGESSEGPSAASAPGCDHCRDYSVAFTQVTLSHGEYRTSAVQAEGILLAVPAQIFKAVFPTLPQEPCPYSSGPPAGPNILSHLSTIVLQV